MEIFHLWLKLCGKLSNSKFLPAIDHFGSCEAIYKADEKTLADAELFTDREIKLLSNKNLDAVNEELKLCRQYNTAIVTYGSEFYPPLLCDLPDPPPYLYVCGNPSCLCMTGITIVGSRRPTLYGPEVAGILARELSEVGYLVISGFAKGIDSAAHWGSVAVRGETVAVLGCGIDQNYPVGNDELKKSILENGGALISEFAFGTAPSAGNFPFRNRVIAGMSVATVVVEAEAKSGSLITAHCAAEQGKEVFAVPGSILSPCSEGTNSLLADGVAPVVSSKTLIDYLYDKYPPDIELPDFSEVEPKILKVAEKPKSQKPTKSTSLIHDALADGEKTIDEIASFCKKSSGEISAELIKLEMQGEVTYVAGNRYKLHSV